MTRPWLWAFAVSLLLFSARWDTVVYSGEETSDLIKMLSSPNVKERRETALQLGRLKDPASVAPLIQALHDPDPMVRLDVSGALIDIGSPVEEPLIEAVKRDKDDAFLWNAIRILDSLGDPRAIEPLKEIAKSHPDPNIQQSARYTVERLQKAGKTQ